MRDPKEVKGLYKKLATLARIPGRYIYDSAWMRANPSLLKSNSAYNEGKYVRVRASEQDYWMRRFLRKPKSMRKPYFIAVLGDQIADGATKVGMGLACHAIRQGLKVRAFHVAELRWDNQNAIVKPVDETGATKQYDLVVLHGVHTDDVQMRRQLTRDFIVAWEGTFRIMVMAGEDPLRHLHMQLGLNPHGIFYYPHDPKYFRMKAIEI